MEGLNDNLKVKRHTYTTPQQFKHIRSFQEHRIFTHLIIPWVIKQVSTNFKGLKLRVLGLHLGSKPVTKITTYLET